MAVSKLNPVAAGITVSDGNSAGWGSTEPQWTSIATSTTTGASVTFSGISGYRYLRLYIRDYVSGTSTTPRVQVNSTTTGYSLLQHAFRDNASNILVTNYGDSDAHYIAYYTATSSYNHNGGFVDFYNVNTSLPYKEIEGHFGSINGSSGEAHCMSRGTWKNTSAITSITVTLYSTSFATNSGGLALYGAN